MFNRKYYSFNRSVTSSLPGARRRCLNGTAKQKVFISILIFCPRSFIISFGGLLVFFPAYVHIILGRVRVVGWWMLLDGRSKA